MSLSKKRSLILTPDFLNIWSLVSWESLAIGARFFCKKLSHLDGLSMDIIKLLLKNFRFLVSLDNGLSCHMILRNLKKWL